MNLEDCKLENSSNELLRIDNFEDNIKLLDKLTKEYKEIKDQLKAQMLKIGKENDLTQVKWVTPKGIKITLSVGQEAEFERKTKKEFDLETFKNECPEIYEKYLIDKEYLETIRPLSNDRLVVTLPKE